MRRAFAELALGAASTSSTMSSRRGGASRLCAETTSSICRPVGSDNEVIDGADLLVVFVVDGLAEDLLLGTPSDGHRPQFLRTRPRMRGT